MVLEKRQFICKMFYQETGNNVMALNWTRNTPKMKDIVFYFSPILRQIEGWGIISFALRNHCTEQESQIDGLLEQFRDGRELLELNYVSQLVNK